MNNLKNIKNILFDCDGVLYKDLDCLLYTSDAADE